MWARLAIPTPWGGEQIDAECEVCYLSANGGGFALGMRFLGMSAANAMVLQSFIEESLIPR